MFYEYDRGYSADKLQVSLIAEPVVCRETAKVLSLFVQNDFPVENVDSAPSAYTFIDEKSLCSIKVASLDANFCNSLNFSISGLIVHTRFFSLNAVANPLVLLADSAALSKLNFTVSPLATASRLYRQKTPEYRNRECRVFLNQVVYLNKGVLRL